MDTGCEDPSAPELWTDIELVNAVLDLEFELKQIPLRVSAVNDFLYDPKNISPGDIDLVYPELTPETMQTVALCAAGIANRYEYRTARFSTSDGIRRGTDTILVGDPEFLRSKLSRFGLPDRIWKTIRGPHLSIHHLPVLVPDTAPDTLSKTDPRHALVIVSGRDAKEILEASKVLSLLSMPLPDAPSVHLADLQVPPLAPHRLKNGLEPGNTYSLKALGMESFTFEGMNPVPRGITFRVPSSAL